MVSGPGALGWPGGISLHPRVAHPGKLPHGSLGPEQVLYWTLLWPSFWTGYALLHLQSAFIAIITFTYV